MYRNTKGKGEGREIERLWERKRREREKEEERGGAWSGQAPCLADSHIGNFPALLKVLPKPVLAEVLWKSLDAEPR